MKCCITCFFLFSTVLLYGQNGADATDRELKKFFIGVNAGGYFGNKKTANFYNGGTVNGISRILNTTYYRDQIDQELSYDWSFGEFPEQMKYSVALQLGVHLGFHVSDNIAIIGDVDIINLKTQDYVTFLIDDPNNGSPEPTIETMPILGEEKRLNFNVGFQNYLSKENNTFVYWSMALNATSTKFVDNTLKIRNLSTYYIGDPLWIGSINPNNGTVISENGRTKPGGTGFGGLIGMGVKFKFNEKFVFDLGYNLIYTTIKLSDYNSEFKQRGVQHSLFLRVIWG
jgi:hypothetical protein